MMFGFYILPSLDVLLRTGAAGKDMGREYLRPPLFSLEGPRHVHRVAFGRLLSNLKAEERQR